MESLKSERFRRVAAQRVQRVLDSIDNLAKCSRKNNYEYTSDEVSKMLRAIKAKIKGLEQAFGDDGGRIKEKVFHF